MKAYKILFLDHRTYCINSLGDSLAQMGHKIMYQPSWVPKEVESGIAYFKPDILITVGYNRRLFSLFADRIAGLCKKYGLFHLYWATEDLINHKDWSLPYVQRTRPDLVWSIHPGCIKKYEKLGIPASYLNFGFNPRMFPKKKRGAKEIYDISFVGSAHLFKKTYRYDSLQHLLFPLIEIGQKVHIWGSDWQKNEALIAKEFGKTVPRDWLQGYLLYGKSGSVYCSSKIVLGVQNAVDQVSQRTFEILGSGAFMITSRTQEITEMFEDKKELVLTSSPEETIELVRYYLNRPELRYKIGANAHRKVIENYTYRQHITKIWPKAEFLIKLKWRKGLQRRGVL
ncbi:Spore maturation protein CgeB [Anaerovirgula multivorans]|uniref:Spore maturation protein CgeB n=1 Tax=Anaerovirgula multivorans TaxID=312168 RepID=A0A238ZPG7_9FIRM|nr:glycosyltransferase [Anaerovirgula multivorans]SNR85277.1 Spore maturation protein CgeB [Anaerovirgula multivorans]